MIRTIKVAGLAALTLTAFASTAPLQAQDAVSLSVQSAWPLTLPASGRDAQHFSDAINEASGGSVEIELYGAGKLVPSLEIFDAVQRGTLDAGYTSPLYVAGKFPALQLFGGVPFGPDAIEYLGWIYNGGGLDIWREIYAEQAGGDIFPNLERGVIDGTEFSMPAIDAIIGFDDIAKNYYLPGWHQPAAINELIINKAKWDAMSDAQRTLIELTCRETMLWGVTSTLAENAAAVQAFKENGVEIREFSPELIEAFREKTAEVMAEQSEKDANFKRVWDSLQAYRDNAADWASVRND